MLEHTEENDDTFDKLETWEAKLLDNEDQPEFYDTLDVISLRSNLNKVVIAVIIVNILTWLWSLPVIQMLIETRGFPQLSDIATYIPSMLVTTLGVGLQTSITCFSLIALSYILRILMEMEFNSRKAK